MLVLTRKHQEKIRIGDDIVITVLRTKGKAVRLGIEAPATVPVVRGELAFEAAKTGDGGEVEDDSNRDGAAAATTIVKRNRVPTVRAGSSWPSESPSIHEARKSDSQVTLRRIPREKLAEMLPRLASDAGPLRSMLDQRSTT